MEVAPAQEGGDVHRKSFEAEDSKAAAGNGLSILIPDDITSVLIMVKPTTCTAKFQWTPDSVASVKADTCEWYNSDDGLVAVDTPDVIYRCTAVRLVQVGAGSSIIIVGAS